MALFIGYKMKRLTQEEFINRAIAVHGNKYNYGKVVYDGSRAKVEIICHIHGSFWQTPAMHLQGQGCPRCKDEKTSKRFGKTQDEFIQQAIGVHGNRYDYSKVQYNETHTNVCIICNKCGKEFWQTPHNHLEGQGCHWCAGKKKTTEMFKGELYSIYGDTYILDKVEYINATTKVCMVCKEHGEFYALPNNILSGQGCPNCYKHKGEERVERFLKNKNIKYVTQYEIPNECVLIPNKLLRVDFFLPDANTFIEYNGGQHYFPVKMFGGQKQFEHQQERDYALRKYCKEHKIKLIEIPYTEYGNVE